MTQTIKHCNEIPVCQKHDRKDFRTAASVENLCELVDAGHPIAYIGEEPYLSIHHKDFNTTVVSGEARLLRAAATGGFGRIKTNYFFDFFYKKADMPTGEWVARTENEGNLLKYVKLAPLAYKNGRPLHLGDRIIVFNKYMQSPPPSRAL